jgi:hypothetical protein
MKYLIFILLSTILLTARAKSSEEVVNVKIACYNTDMLLEKLRDTYKEYPMIMGITSDKASSTMSVWINPVTKTWTIVATKEKVSCVIGSGTDIEIVPSKKEPML